MSERILKAARNVVACIRRERELKAQIDWKACKFYEDSEMVGEDATGYPGRECCPFVEDRSNDQGSDIFTEDVANGKLKRSEWCATCECNWTLRGQWAKERQRRPNYLRTLENAVMAEAAKCSACKGLGWHGAKPCDLCGGTATLPVPR